GLVAQPRVDGPFRGGPPGGLGEEFAAVLLDTDIGRRNDLRHAVGQHPGAAVQGVDRVLAAALEAELGVGAVLHDAPADGLHGADPGPELAVAFAVITGAHGRRAGREAVPRTDRLAVVEPAPGAAGELPFDVAERAGAFQAHLSQVAAVVGTVVGHRQHAAQ